MGFDIQGAKDAGYSDEEIANFLGEDVGFDTSGALKAGYSLSEIVDHISGGDKSAGGGRGFVNPAPAKQEYWISDRADELAKLNQGATRDQLIGAATAEFERLPKGKAKTREQQYRDTLDQSQYVSEEGLNESAKLNAASDEVTQKRLNKFQKNAPLDSALGDSASIPYNPIIDSARAAVDQKERSAIRERLIQEDKDAQALSEGPSIGSLAQDTIAGTSKILPVAAKGITDIASVVTDGSVGRDAGKAIDAFQKDVDTYIRSDRGNAQSRQFERDMADPNKNFIDVIANNKGALLDQLLPQAGSMALPIGAAGVAGKVAQSGKFAQGLEAAALAARAGKAEQAASIATTVFQNASDAFNTVLNKGGSLEQAYLAAGITAPFTAIAGKLTGGGAETALALRLFNRANSTGKLAANEAQVFGAALLKAAGKEAGQESVEQIGQDTGEAWGAGKEVDLSQTSKNVAVAGTLGAVMGGGVHGLGKIGSGNKEMSLEDSLIHALQTGQTVPSTIPNQTAATSQNSSEQISGQAPGNSAQAAIENIAPAAVTSPIPRTSDSELLARIPQAADVMEAQTVDQAIGAAQAVMAATPVVTPTSTVAVDAVPSLAQGVLGELGVENGRQSGGLPDTVAVGEGLGDGVLRPGAYQGRGEGVSGDADARANFQADLDREAAKNPNNPVVKLDAPEPEAAASLQRGVELTKAMFGNRAEIRLFADESPTSANGIYDGNRKTIWVNTKGLTFNALGTGWHEFHHVLQGVAEADDRNEAKSLAAGTKWAKTPEQKYRDRVDGIYTTMSINGRAAYAGNFLFAGEVNAMPEAKQFLNGREIKDLSHEERQQFNALRTKLGKKLMHRPLLQREMMADFVGNRATDKKFVESMAEADPVGFAQWAKNWLRAVGELLESLRGRGDTYSKSVDKYVSDLEKSRAIFQEALLQLKKDGDSNREVKTEGDSGFARKGVIGEVAPHPGSTPVKDVDGKEIPKERGEMSRSEKLDSDRKEFAGRWDQQEGSEKEMANRSVAQKTFRKIADRHELRGWSLSFSSGQYEGKTNPNFIIDAPESATREQIEAVARELGHALDQKSMVVFDEGNTSGQNQNSFVKVVLPDGFPKGKLQELREHIANEFPGADSNTLATQNELAFGNFTRFSKNELSDEEFEAGIDAAVASFDYDGESAQVSGITRYDSELIWPGSRKQYLKEGVYDEGNQVQTRPEDSRSILRSPQGRDLVGLRGIGAAARSERANWIDNSKSGREYLARGRERLADATATTTQAEVDYGSPIKGAAFAVGVHFSQQRRNVLTSQAFGTGIKGAELKRLSEKYNADIKPRIYFYVDAGKGVTPETGVGSAKHIVKLNNLYSTIDDNLGLAKNNTGSTPEIRSSNFERAVKKAGFDGYLADNGGNQRFAVLIGRHDINMPQYQAREWNSIDDISDLGNFNLDRDFDEDVSFDEPSIEELNAQIDAEEKAFRAKMAARAKNKLKNPKTITVEEMSAHGVHPEKAMPFGAVTEEDYSVSIDLPEGYAGRSNLEIAERGGEYFPYTADTFPNRGMTKEMAVEHAKAMYALPLIHKAGFDLASAYRKGTVLKLASKWKQLASLNGIFKTAKKSSLTNFSALFNEIGANPAYTLTEISHSNDLEIHFKKGQQRYVAIIAVNGKEAKACTMGLDGSGDLGTAFYAAASQWAKNNGLKFYADSALSSINTARRTEQSFSYALKTGDTGTLLPGAQNRVYGYNEDPVNEQDHLMNIGRLAIAGMRNAIEVDANIRRLKYDPNKDQFTDQSGADAEDKATAFIQSKDARAFGMGRTTLARAVLTSQIIKGDIGVVKEFASPIAYQARGEDYDIGEGWGDSNGLNPKIKRFLGNSKLVTENGVPIVMYHGTSRDIQTFNPKQANAIFLTYNPDFADDFSMVSQNWIANKFETELTPEQLKAATTQAIKTVMDDKSTRMSERKQITADIKAGKFDGAARDAMTEAAKDQMGTGPNILPLIVRAEHPFDFRNKAHVNEAMLLLFGDEESMNLTVEGVERGYQPDDVEMAIRSGMREIIEAPEVQRVIRDELAHDSFFVMETGQLNLAVYDRNQIKSAIGNNGNYDLEDDRIDFAKKAGPNEFSYEDNYLVPEVEGFFDDNSGSIATIPALAFQKDGIRRQYPAMKVRIQIGSHQRDKRGDFVKQYGLQHRIENKQETPSARGYVTPDIGSESAQEVERAARDITLGVLDSQTAYADGSPTKVYLHAPALNRSTVLEVKTDSSGEKFWSVVTSMPSTREQMMRRYKAPTSVVGTTLNGERTQQAFDIKLGILNKLKEPGQSPVTAEAYIIDEDGKLFHQNREKQLVPVVKKQPTSLKRDANGKIILNKNKAPEFSRKQPAAQGYPEETRLQGVQRVMQDKYNRVKLIQDLIAEDGGIVGEEQDVHRAEERMHGRVHEVLRQFADDVVHPLIQKAVDYKIDLNELAAYAYAKHAQERNEHIQKTNTHVKTGSGMSNDEADNIIQLVQHSGDAAAFDELHNDLLAITATTRRVMLDEGLITQNQYDGLENQYDNYVPLRGFEDVDPDSGKVRPGLGRGFNTKGKETIAAMGRDSKAGDIIENIIRDYERVTIRAERNAVGKTFLDLVTSNPDPALWEVQPMTRATRKVNGLTEYVDVADKGDETISVKVAGEQVYIKINDPLLLRAMANTFKSETSDVERFLTKTLGRYTSLLRNTITRYNPAFGVINAVRDSQMGAAGVFDELGAEGLRRYTMNYGAAMMSAGRTEFNASNPQGKVMDRWMREMRFAGGTAGGVFMRDHEMIRKEMRDAMLQAGVKPDGVIEIVRSSKAWWATGKILQGLELVGSMSENAARLAAYATAREMGKTPAQAASIAKNLTVNFNRFGESGQLINTAYLFYNASVQGSVRIFQMAKNPKVRYAMAGMAAAGFGLAMMGAAVGGDDDDGQPYWDKIPDFEKERNLIFMLPPGSDIGAKVGTHGRYIKLPMAYGLNVFPVLGIQLADLARHAADPAKGVSVGKAAINLFSAVAGSYNPIGGSIDPRDWKQAFMAAMPTAIDAPFQLGMGIDSFGKPTGPKKSEYDSSPDSENVSAQNHGTVNHRIARWINDATGGNQARPGAIDIEPGTLKNIQGIVGGGLGKFIGDIVNLGYLGATDAPIKTRDIPIYKAFYGEYDSKSGMTLFYERSRKAKEEFDVMVSEHKQGIKREYSAEEKFLQGMGAYAKSMGEAMGELKKHEVYIAESKSTDKEKELKRRMLQAKREKMAEDFNAKWYDKESKLKRTGS